MADSDRLTSVTSIEFCRRTLSASSLQGKRTKSGIDDISEAVKNLEVRTKKFENKYEGGSYSTIQEVLYTSCRQRIEKG